MTIAPEPIIITMATPPISTGTWTGTATRYYFQGVMPGHCATKWPGPLEEQASLAACLHGKPPRPVV